MNDVFVAQFEKRYLDGATIEADLRQEVDAGSITVLFGPSGCGKTTTLRCLAGLERPELGRIVFKTETWFDGQQRLCRSPQQRDVGFLFQDYALFPHLTVGPNIGYGLRKLGQVDRRRRVDEAIERFQLNGLVHRYPHQISGGQQQRVALARVLVRRPRMLLLDEPLSSLDSSLRDALRNQLRQQLKEFEIPTVLVTHDRIEAIALADRIVVMDAGKIRQQGTVQDVFTRPCDLHVAGIVGIETVESGEIVRVEDGLATVHVGKVILIAVAPDSPGRQVHVCIKGEDVILQREAQTGISVRNQLPALIRWLTPEGPLVRVGLDCGFELSALVTRPAFEELQLQVGDRVTACIKAPSIHLISKAYP